MRSSLLTCHYSSCRSRCQAFPTKRALSRCNCYEVFKVSGKFCSPCIHIVSDLSRNSYEDKLRMFCYLFHRRTIFNNRKYDALLSKKYVHILHPWMYWLAAPSFAVDLYYFGKSMAMSLSKESNRSITDTTYSFKSGIILCFTVGWRRDFGTSAEDFGPRLKYFRNFNSSFL